MNKYTNISGSCVFGYHGSRRVLCTSFEWTSSSPYQGNDWSHDMSLYIFFLYSFVHLPFCPEFVFCR